MPVKYPLLAISRLRMEVDGEGVTTLVAGSGCPLACRWCINRELLKKTPTFITPEELYDRVKIDDLYFRATGGGVTFGGGEPLLHTAFLSEFRKLCPDWKLCAETSLHVERQAVLDAASIFDAFIVDVKTSDIGVYRAYTGAERGAVFAHLEWLLTSFDPDSITVRIPLIPGYNTPALQKKTAEAVKALGATQLELFQYVTR